MSARVRLGFVTWALTFTGVCAAQVSAQPSPARTPPAQPAARTATPQTQADLLSRIEARLRRALSPGERSAIAEASRRQVQELQAVQSAFAQDIARITSLPVGDVGAMLPKIGQSNEGFDRNIVPRIEARLRRKLTASELQQLRAADQKKKSSMQPVRQRFAAEVARFTGLAAAEVITMLPRIGQ